MKQIFHHLACLTTLAITTAGIVPIPTLHAQETPAAPSSETSSSAPKMSMKEKRLVKNLTESEIPFHVRTFKEMTGGDLSIEIDWDQWAGDETGLLNLNGYVLQQFTDTLITLSSDEIGKEALRTQIKTLKVVPAASAEDKSILLKDGVLLFTVKPSEGWDGTIKNGEIREYLLENL